MHVVPMNEAVLISLLGLILVVLTAIWRGSALINGKADKTEIIALQAALDIRLKETAAALNAKIDASMERIERNMRDMLDRLVGKDTLASKVELFGSSVQGVKDELHRLRDDVKDSTKRLEDRIDAIDHSVRSRNNSQNKTKGDE